MPPIRGKEKRKSEVLVRSLGEGEIERGRKKSKALLARRGAESCNGFVQVRAAIRRGDEYIFHSRAALIMGISVGEKIPWILS